MNEVVSFFDVKPYDKTYFDPLKEKYGMEIQYYEENLNANTVFMAKGSSAVIAFVNDTIDEKVLHALDDMGIHILALRCAGYNNVDLKAAYGKVHVVRVPAYSPYAVAEHAMGMLMMLNRKFHRANNRVREYNFSLNGLIGFDLYDKTVGVVGTGKIGKVFIDICRGFGMNVLAYDPYPLEDESISYVELDELFQKSDIISLHCPLTRETHHMVNKHTIELMKDGVYVINTSRGALIDSDALLEGILSEKIGAAALDVYEEETEFFYEDFSDTIVKDDVLARFISLPNVLVTSHQAFFTKEALENIAETTFENLEGYFDDNQLPNEICYQCQKNHTCKKEHKERCF